MTKFIFKNQQLLSEKNATISINERGFLFGDGIFETCKIHAGQIYDYKSHEARIKKGLKRLKINAAIDDLAEKSQKLIIKNKIENGLLRISITRGIGSIGYLPSKNCQPLIIIQTQEDRPLPPKISLKISTIKKSAFLSDCKSNNALPYILSKLEAVESGYFDGIMLSSDGFISETSSANIFWIKNDKIYTASKACEILPGTVRKHLIKILPVKIIEKKARVNELKNADEVFLTNSAFLLVSVDEIKFRSGVIKKFSKKIGKELRMLLLEEQERLSLFKLGAKQ